MATRAEIRTRIRQRTDNEHLSAEFVTDDELNGLINVKYKRLYGKLVRHGLHRAESTQTITADGSASYVLPSDLWAVLAVFREDAYAGEPVYLERHDHRVRPNSTWRGPADTYRVVGPNIEFNPRPSDGTYTVVYIPVPADLDDDADVLDGVLGFEEWVVLSVSIDVLTKEEAHETVLLLKDELAQIERDILDDAAASEMSESVTVADVRKREYRLPGAYGVRGYRGSPGSF